MTHYILIFCFSVLAIFTHGYQFGVSDQEIFIPYILKWQQPALFPDDILFSQLSSKTSIFYPVFGMLAKIIDIETLFFMSYLFFQFFFFLAVFRLSSVILKDKNLAYASLAIFMLPKFIGGTTTSTFDDFLGYRSIGVIFLLSYLSYLLEKKFREAIVFASLGFLFHPLSIITSIMILPALYIRQKLNFSPKIQIAAILLVSILTVILMVPLPKDDLWLSIIKSRDAYLFPSTWGINGWLALFLYFALIFALIRKIRLKLRSDLLLIITICLTIFIGNFIVLEIFKTPSVAKFQLARSITPIVYISLAACPLLLVKKSTVGISLGLLCFISLSLNMFEFFLVFLVFFLLYDLLRQSPTFNLKLKTGSAVILIFAVAATNFLLEVSFGRKSDQKIQYPKHGNDWISLQEWVRENTSKNSVFLVPPTQTGFRIYSQRSIVGDIKDGAVVMYSPHYAKRWFQITSALKDYQNLGTIDVLNLKNLYLFNYVITYDGHSLDFEIVYKNDRFIMYKI